GGIEAEMRDKKREALRRADLAIVLVADALGLLPAPLERPDEGLERDAWRECAECLVERPRRGADHAAVDPELRQAVPVEAHERVEEVEQDGAVGHGRGFR